MKLILTILLSGVALTGSAFAGSVDCSRHKVYCAIKKLRPTANSAWAMKLSNIIYKEAKKIGIDPKLSVAIAMQETSLRHINRKQKIIVEKEVCDLGGKPCMIVHEIVSGYSDLGLYQFHVNTIIHYKIDINQLDDLEYATKMHFKILADKLKMCKKHGDQAWTCYHSKTERLRNRYYEDVIRYYNEVK